MTDRLERACQECGSLLHHEDDCPRKDDVVEQWRRYRTNNRYDEAYHDLGDALAAEVSRLRVRDSNLTFHDRNVMAVNEHLQERLEAAERVVEAAREWLDFSDPDNQQAITDTLRAYDATKNSGGSGSADAATREDADAAPSGSVGHATAQPEPASSRGGGANDRADVRPERPQVAGGAAKPPTRVDLARLIEEACSIMFDFQVASADAAPGWSAAERAEDWAERAKAATLEAGEPEPESAEPLTRADLVRIAKVSHKRGNVRAAAALDAYLAATSEPENLEIAEARVAAALDTYLAATLETEGLESAEHLWNWLCDVPDTMATGVARIEQRDAAVRAARDREWAAAYVAPGGNPVLGPKDPAELTGYLKGRDQALAGIEECKAIRRCAEICDGVALAHDTHQERHFANGARECAEKINELLEVE